VSREAPSLFHSDRWTPTVDAAPFVDMFQARIPPVPLEPLDNERSSNGTSNGASKGEPDGSADADRPEPATSGDDERSAQPEPDVSRR